MMNAIPETTFWPFTSSTVLSSSCLSLVLHPLSPSCPYYLWFLGSEISSTVLIPFLHHGLCPSCFGIPGIEPLIQLLIMVCGFSPDLDMVLTAPEYLCFDPSCIWIPDIFPLLKKISNLFSIWNKVVERNYFKITNNMVGVQSHLIWCFFKT